MGLTPEGFANPPGADHVALSLVDREGFSERLGFAGFIVGEPANDRGLLERRGSDARVVRPLCQALSGGRTSH